jgi:hypothetical protein
VAVAVVLVALESMVQLMVTDGQPDQMVVPVPMAVVPAMAMLLAATNTVVVAVVVTIPMEEMGLLVLLLLFSNFNKNDGNQTLCKNR